MPVLSSMINGDVKCVLGTFEVRKTDHSQVSEFKRLLVYLYQSKSPILQPYLVTLAGCDIETAYNKGIIGELILDLTLEQVDRNFQMQTYLEWLYTRCFQKNKSCGHLALRSPGSCSSLCATALYILREGAMIMAAKNPKDPNEPTNAEDTKLMMTEIVQSTSFQRVDESISHFRLKKRAVVYKSEN